jgi:bifunctional ADP-heptose synthase (sugar kinase/adenylyltransferase)
MLKKLNIITQLPFFQSDYEPNSDEIIKTRIMNIDTNKQILRIDDKVSFDREHIENHTLDFSFLCAKHSFSAIVVSDYQKGIVNEELIKYLELSKVPVFVDTKKKDLSVFKNIKNCYIKVNSKEFENAQNKELIKHLIKTEGQNGASYYSEGKFVASFKTFEVKSADVVGARRYICRAICLEYFGKK